MRCFERPGLEQRQAIRAFFSKAWFIRSWDPPPAQEALRVDSHIPTKTAAARWMRQHLRETRCLPRTIARSCSAYARPGREDQRERTRFSERNGYTEE